MIFHVSILVFRVAIGWSVFPLFSKSYKPEWEKVVKRCKNDPQKIFVQSVKALRFHNGTLFL